MNAVVERLGWMLLHSLWEDASIWLLLQVVLLGLKRKTAEVRYAAACVALVSMALLPWMTFGSLDLAARLRGAPAQPERSVAVVGPASSSVAASFESDPPSLIHSPEPIRRPVSSMSPRSYVEPLLRWLVIGWALGVAIFAARLWSSWRYVRWLARLPLPELSGEWQQRFAALCRTARVRSAALLGETAAVAVPVVIGWVRPVILLPLGVLAQLPVEQVEAILLHELAHIRRHDFIVNLLQSGVETLFFYHPAVRSVSRNIREERERICDDLSVEWCRNPVVYAEALTTFEEYRRQSLALAATGEGDLLARVRRIILGVEPRQRAASLFAVAGLLAIAAYLASMFLAPLLAAELMTDKERVAQIGALQLRPPVPGNSDQPGENVLVTGALRTEDGQPLPKSLIGNQNLKQSEAKVASSWGGYGASGGLTMEGDHSYYGNTMAGRIQLGVWAEGYAPLRKTILRAQGGNLKVDLTLRRGFPARAQVVGSDGKPLEGVTLTAISAREGETIELERPAVRTDSEGFATFGNVEADSDIHLNLFKPGWQMADQEVSRWSDKTPQVCKMAAAQATAGVVLDRATRQPIANAKIIMAARRGTGDSYLTYEPENGQVLGHSDDHGRFHLETLAQNSGYYVYVQAAGYQLQSFPISYGQQGRVCELTRGLRLRGKILDPQGILTRYRLIELQVMYDLQASPFNGYGRSQRKTLRKLAGEIPFDFENLPEGRTGINFGTFGLESYSYEVNLQKDVDDYVIDLRVKPPTTSRSKPDPRPLRSLEVAIKTDSDAVPGGALNADYLTIYEHDKGMTSKSAPITGGKAVLSLPVPTTVDLYADQIVGYWFAPQHFDMPVGDGVFAKTITATRAGVIHGNINLPPPLENRSLSVLPIVVKPPSGLTIKNLTSGTMIALSPKKEYVTPSLPFGGLYAILVDAGPSYFVSDPVLVDAEHPIVIQDLVLKAATETLKGRFVNETKQPISYKEVMLTYHPNENDTLVSHSATTDGDGSFAIPAINFAAPGNYEAQIYGEEWEKTSIRIDRNTPQPVVISLKRKVE